MQLGFFFFFSSRRRHTRSLCDWSSDVCSSDLSDHCVCVLVDLNDAPDHGTLAAETRLPEVIAQRNHRRGIRLLAFLRRKSASQNRLHTKPLKIIDRKSVV